MRPLRLELEGFGSFRSPTTVDFEGADLFVLSGPTGAGKTTVVDALTFCLYGSVPRYDDRRLVAPAISQGKVQARVRLDFAVDGKAYTAVRVVRRTKTGASTREARLERPDGSVLAGNERELTAAVERIVGLPFEHFTKCVVLPQGDFAEFLHAKPSERQDLLVRLLDLDVYRRIAQEANRRASDAEARADLLAQHLERDLSDVGEDTRAGAAEGVTTLEALLARIEEERPEIETLRDEVREARREAAAADAHATSLAGIAVPAGLGDLAGEIAAATRTVGEAAEAHAQARAQADDAAEARASLPDPGELRALLEGHARADHLATELRDAAQRCTEAAAAEESAGRAAEEASASVAAARSHLDDLRRAHTAADLARHLEAGQPCPVCQQAVETLPAHELPADLAAAEAALEAAVAAEQVAGAALRDATAQRVAAEREHARIDEELADQTARLEAAPPAGELRSKLDLIAAADQRLAETQATERRAREVLETARSAEQRLQGAREDAWRAFDLARDAVAALQPPPVDRGDLAGAWVELTAWATTTAAAQRQLAEAARQREAVATARGSEIQDRLRDACLAAGVDAAERDPRDACADALAAARSSFQRIEADLTEAARVAADRAAVTGEGRIARALGRHLSARGFEKWLMGRALRRLVAGGSQLLRDLSQDAYSLDLDDDNAFLVVDHRNADERRSVRTLSGGETFLASLALALALAEDVAELAAEGAARLEALFLDEGFGTLDADTLDTVAAAIEELGARGRMVGIITHVRELADRVPVRFEVTRNADGSHVARTLN